MCHVSFFCQTSGSTAILRFARRQCTSRTDVFLYAMANNVLLFDPSGKHMDPEKKERLIEQLKLHEGNPLLTAMLEKAKATVRIAALGYIFSIETRLMSTKAGIHHSGSLISERRNRRPCNGATFEPIAPSCIPQR